MLRRLSTLVVGIVAYSSIGCGSGTTEAKAFCSVDKRERLELFRSYPIEKRYELFVNADNEPSCNDDSLAAGSYLIDDIVAKDSDIDFLYRKLEESTDEIVQQDIIWALYKNQNRLIGKTDIAKLAIEKSAAMKGTLLDRIIGSTIAVDHARKWAYEIESAANSNKQDKS